MGYWSSLPGASETKVPMKLWLYLSLFILHPDYVVQFWSSYNTMDIIKLEFVQRKITKIIQLTILSYSNRVRY